MTWRPVHGAGLFEVYLFNHDGLGLVQHTAGIDGNRFVSIPVPDGNYRVWVKSSQANGGPGLWSRPLSFVVAAAATGTVVTPVSPVTPTFHQPPVFTWTDSGSPEYDLYLTNGHTVITQTVSTNSWTPATTLAQGSWQW